MTYSISDTKTELLNARLRRTVGRIKDSVGVDRRTFQDMLGVLPSRYAELRFQKSDFSIDEIYSLADALKLDMDLLFSGRIDYQALARQFKGDLTALPERYQNDVEKMARARAAQVIFAHLSLYHGEDYARSYFRRIQIHPEAFSNPTDFIHPRITTDLIKGLGRENYSEDQIRGVGTMTLALFPEVVRKRLLASRTPRELYSYILEEYAPRQYDRIYHYKLESLSADRCRVVSQITELAQSVFVHDPIDNREACLYRQGVFSSFYGVLGKKLAQIEEVSCVHLGDRKCEIDIVWA